MRLDNPFTSEITEKVMKPGETIVIWKLNQYNMKDKKRNCLVFLVLFICLTVCAQSSDEVKAMRNLRDYYTQNINTYDINQNMGKWDLYLKQLSEEGQFADLAAYEKKKIHDNNWLSSVSFQDQQDIGFLLGRHV